MARCRQTSSLDLCLCLFNSCSFHFNFIISFCPLLYKAKISLFQLYLLIIISSIRFNGIFSRYITNEVGKATRKSNCQILRVRTNERKKTRQTNQQLNRKTHRHIFNENNRQFSLSLFKSQNGIESGKSMFLYGCG